MTNNDIKTICEKIESLHEKILKSKFAETVTESEMLSLILAVRELNDQKAEIDNTCVFLEEQRKCSHQEHEKQMKMLKQIKEQIPLAIARARNEAIKEFAERLKMRTRKMQSSDFGGEFWDKAVLAEDIDNLAKEMTEVE